MPSSRKKSSVKRSRKKTSRKKTSRKKSNEKSSVKQSRKKNKSVKRSRKSGAKRETIKNNCEGVYNLRWKGTHDQYPFVTLSNSFRGEVGGVFKLLDQEYMVRALGDLQFSDRKIPIPVGIRKMKLNDFQKRAFCHEKTPQPKLAGLELSDWIESVANKVLRIKGIMKMKKGEKIPILIMHRNLGDMVTQGNKGNRLYKPEFFFKDAKAIYIHDKGLQGYIIWAWDEKKKKEPFEFELEYQPHQWYPLRNGSFPAQDPQGFAKFKYNKPRSWEKFPKTTKVGWRGPILPWNVVKKQKDVWWYNQNA